MRGFTSKALIALSVFLPALAAACPVCGQAPEQSRGAYLAMTAVMTFLPLVVIAGLFYAALRVFRRAAKEQALTHPRPTDAPLNVPPSAPTSDGGLDPGRQTSEAFEA